MKFEFNKNVFSCFLAILSVYVQWESLEGGPYRKIRELGTKDTIELNMNDNQMYTLITKSYLNDYLRDFDTNLPLEYNNNKKVFDINFNKFEDSFNSYYRINFPVDFTNRFIYKDEELNEYFQLSNSGEDSVNNYNSPLCRLGDKDIFFEIKYIENKKEVDYKKVIDPNITNYAKKLLARRINEYYFNKNQS